MGRYCFRFVFQDPEITLNLENFAISTDVGSTAGDLFNAINENGWSDLDYGYENLNIEFNLTGDGKVGDFDLDLNVTLEFTFDSEWYSDGDFHSGGIESGVLIIFRLRN